MQIFDITVPANSTFVVHAPGHYFKYMSGSNGGGDATLVITPGMMGGTKVNLAPGQAYRHPASKPTPDSWTLANYSNTATIVGKVVVGDGQIDDPTIAGTVQVVDGGKFRTLSGSAYTAFGFAGGVAAQYSRVQLWNPAGSGKRVVLERLWPYSDNTGAQAMHIKFSSAPLTAMVQVGVQKLAPGASGAAAVYADSSATPSSVYGGAILMACGQPASTNAMLQIDEPYVLPPGTGVVLYSVFAAINLGGTFEWYEELNV
jgi:hypothetical protein